MPVFEFASVGDYGIEKSSLYGDHRVDAAAPVPVLLRSPSPYSHAQDRFRIGEGDRLDDFMQVGEPLDSVSERLLVDLGVLSANAVTNDAVVDGREIEIHGKLLQAILIAELRNALG